MKVKLKKKKDLVKVTLTVGEAKALAKISRDGEDTSRIHSLEITLRNELQQMFLNNEKHFSTLAGYKKLDKSSL